MIDGTENCNRQLAFELQNSHVCEKRSNHQVLKYIFCYRISVSRKLGKKTIYLAGFLNYVTAKIKLCLKQFFFLSKTISKEVKIKTKSAAIAIFFLLLPFSSLFLFSLSLLFSRRIFGFILPSAFGFFLSQKTAIFVRYVFKNPGR